MRSNTTLLMLAGMLAIGVVAPAASAQELILLNGNHHVPVAAFGPSPALQIEEFVSPSEAGKHPDPGKE